MIIMVFSGLKMYESMNTSMLEYNCEELHDTVTSQYGARQIMMNTMPAISFLHNCIQTE